ncbi:MAG: DUF3298 domain-containing protein [Chlorobi bacterium]|nr:DUF3298 domain-containing protein [Chlorobiota bacterium]
MKFIQYLRISWLYLLVLCGFQAYSQNTVTSGFYKHFQGKLDASMNITLDLLSHNGTVSGYYYYSFPEPGKPSTLHYGKTIAVRGTISNGKISFTELNNPESQFSGSLVNDNEISGFWQKSLIDKAVPFRVEENYSNGSIPLSCYAVKDEQLLFNGKNADKASPRAKIEINILFPLAGQDGQTNDSLKQLISKLLLKNNKEIISPMKFLGKLKNDYFDSYIKSSEGIADVSNAKSFNREKNINMQVAYNENQLLSIVLKKFAKTGNSPGMEMDKYFVFSSALNRQLSINDIITENGLPLLDGLLNTKLRKLNGVKPGESLKDAGFFTEEISHNNNFYINNDGIGFLYNIYEIAPGSMGTTALFVSFRELDKSILKPGILPYPR